MALETVTHISDLVVTNPTSTDPKSEGDNHLRNIKTALKTDFPNISGVVNATQGQLNGLLLLPGKNPIINGLFAINQRAPATNADDTYAHDRWYALTQTGTIAVSTLTDVENTTPLMARLTQSQASAQRMGYAQIIEGKNCKHLRGQQVTFRFGRTRLSSSANVRFAVLEWTGTEDTVTSDVVNDWTSSTYTAGNFFLASNITVSGTVQQALTAATLADGSSVTVTLGSSFNNLIVFAWTESTVAQNVTLDLGRSQIEVGAVATPFEHRPIGQELSLCQRYYYRQLNSSRTCFGHINTTSSLIGLVNFPVQMRAAPTALETTGVASDYSIVHQNTPVTVTVLPTFNVASTHSAVIAAGAGTVFTVGQGAHLAVGGNGYLGFPAEL